MIFGKIFSLLSKLLSKLIFWTGRVDNSATFEKPLSEQEEKETFLLMKQGDKQAEEKLIRHNLRLVAHISKKYKNSNTEQEDLISIGTIGLMKAIKTFDYSKGNSFSTYASRCIENEILMNFRSNKKNAQTIFLDDIISTDKDGNKLSLYEVLCDNSQSVDSQIENKILYKKIEKIVLTKLNEREREIIIKRFGLLGHQPKTQFELADELKISRSYISRLEKKAIKTIQNSIILWFLETFCVF